MFVALSYGCVLSGCVFPIDWVLFNGSVRIWSVWREHVPSCRLNSLHVSDVNVVALAHAFAEIIGANGNVWHNNLLAVQCLTVRDDFSLECDHASHLMSFISGSPCDAAMSRMKLTLSLA